MRQQKFQQMPASDVSDASDTEVSEEMNPAVGAMVLKMGCLSTACCCCCIVMGSLVVLSIVRPPANDDAVWDPNHVAGATWPPPDVTNTSMWQPVVPQHFVIQTQMYYLFWLKMVVTPKVVGSAPGEFLSKWSFRHQYYQYLSEGQTKLHVSVYPGGLFRGSYGQIWAGDGSGQHWFIEEDFWGECTFCWYRQRLYKINNQGWHKPEMARADVTIKGGLLWYYAGAYGSIKNVTGAKVAQLTQGSSFGYGLSGFPAWEVMNQDVVALPSSTLAAITVMLEQSDIQQGGYYPPWLSFCSVCAFCCCMSYML